MITSAGVKRWNMMEILFKLSWMSRKINCIVFMDKKLGGSVKPFFTNDQEEEDFICDLANEFSILYDEAQLKLEHPKFCLFQIKPDARMYVVTKILKTGGDELFNIRTSPGPICLFA